MLDELIASSAISSDSFILFVDDGSTDATWKIIEDLSRSSTRAAGISLSKNYGHQNALLAGLMEARTSCDICISIDCDGQDDISAMREMVEAYNNGYDVVYGVRNNRDSDSWFKRMSAEAFYKSLEKLGAEVVFNHADYRLMSQRALDGLSQFREANLYLRGIVPLIGYKSTTVEYTRAARTAGEGHYPLKKMISLAVDGITSLSITPIRMIAQAGVLFSLIGLVGIIWAISVVLTGNAVSGWASTICVICLIGGLQLLSLGVIGEYIGKIYLESKHRPPYIVAERIEPPAPIVHE